MASEESAAGVSAANAGRAVNINIGVLGHIDSGKTSLVRVLSQITSTCALDKHPQSKERGITLDLGFSSFALPAPQRLKSEGVESLQFTLVDCPGHASLIKTIIGGAQIIDAVLLVIDATKGVQTQTAECLVIAEILAQQLLVVLNKVDMIPEAERDAKVSQITARLRKGVFSKTVFGADVPIIPFAANPGAEQDQAKALPPLGLDRLTAALQDTIALRPRDASGGLLFAFDHCFAVRGQGTVMTGTVLSGSVKVGQNVDVPAVGAQAKVRSLQMFRRPVQEACQGDRVAMCLPNIDATKLERGIVTSVGHAVPTMECCLAVVQRIPYFKQEIPNKSKLHCTVGHTTVMGTVQFFAELADPQTAAAPAQPAAAADASLRSVANPSSLGVGRAVAAHGADWPERFDFSKTYHHIDELPAPTQPGAQPAGAAAAGQGGEAAAPGAAPPLGVPKTCYALIRFEKPVQCPQGSLLICSKFDLDQHAPSCRLAFFGRLLESVDANNAQDLARVKVVKPKERMGAIERVEADGYGCICKELFKKETDISLFAGLAVVHVASGTRGVIEGAFGKSGKFRVRFEEKVALPKAGGDKEEERRLRAIALRYNKLVFDKSTKFKQDK